MIFTSAADVRDDFFGGLGLWIRDWAGGECVSVVLFERDHRNRDWRRGAVSGIAEVGVAAFVVVDSMPDSAVRCVD